MSAVFPTREADLDNWLNNFKTLIAATPTNYGLVAGDATSITNAYNAWHTAYLAAINPTTRTKLTIEAKNAQKNTVKGVVRGYAATISACTSATPRPRPSRRPPPSPCSASRAPSRVSWT